HRAGSGKCHPVSGRLGDLLLPDRCLRRASSGCHIRDRSKNSRGEDGPGDHIQREHGAAWRARLADQLHPDRQGAARGGREYGHGQPARDKRRPLHPLHLLPFRLSRRNGRQPGRHQLRYCRAVLRRHLRAQGAGGHGTRRAGEHSRRPGRRDDDRSGGGFRADRIQRLQGGSRLCLPFPCSHGPPPGSARQDCYPEGVTMADFFQNYGFLIVTMAQQSLLAMSLYFPLMAGQLSLASPGFYALGGYIAAVIGTDDRFAPLRDSLGNWVFPLEWLAAGLASALLALLVGVPVLCLNLTITGGAIGIFGVPQLFESRWGYICIFGPLLAGALLFAWRLEQSRIGRAFKAIREDELASDAMGIDTTRYKVLAFVIGGVLAGVVGSMSAPFLNTWNARQGTFDASIAYLAYVLIGGSRSLWGPLLGGMLLTALPEMLRPLKDFRLIINGM